MLRAIVGTAGHIDHGKTRLVEALTGVDCDRWAEEKSRGITIDLGFAHLAEGDLQLGFVDVPGHERFLHNALAGLGGIRLMLLVVAADEGVEPQTREHLAICSLLGIPAAVVALTKADLVEPELVELAQLEIEELLAATPFSGAPVLAVSSLTGQGIEALRATLVAGAREHALGDHDPRPTRLPVDRAFYLKGLGLTVTGTLVAGTIGAGDELVLLPGAKRVRVRGVQVHGTARERATAGERTALRLAGVERGEIARGDQLVTPGAYATSRSLVARFTLLADAPAALSGLVPARVHLASSEVLGKMRPLDPPRLEPGASGLVELKLGAPVVAVAGDRLVVRRPSPAATLGGGTVLDPAWRRPRGGKATTAAVAALAGSRRDLLLHWATQAGEAGLEAGAVAERLGVLETEAAAELGELAGDGLLLAAPAGHGHHRRWLRPAVYQRVAARAEKALSELFARDRLATGMAKAEAVERFFPGRAGELADVYLAWLAAEGVIALAGDRVTRPGRRAQLSGEESALAKTVRERMDAAGLAPPSPGELADRLGAKRQILEGVLRYLTERGELVRLPNGHLIAATAVDTLVGELAASGWQRFTVPQFKDRFGLTRKWAIPLLEHLDSVGATRRTGDERLVVGGS